MSRSKNLKVVSRDEAIIPFMNPDVSCCT